MTDEIYQDGDVMNVPAEFHMTDGTIFFAIDAGSWSWNELGVQAEGCWGTHFAQNKRSHVLLMMNQIKFIKLEFDRLEELLVDETIEGAEAFLSDGE